MLRILLGWLFCLLALLLAAPLLRLLAQPRQLAPAPDLVYLDQFLSALIASAGLAGLLIAFLLRLAGRVSVALLLLAPAMTLCAWHLTHTHLGPVSPTSEQYRLLLAGLALYALVLAGINWLNRGESGPRTVLRYLGLASLLPWSLGLLYLGRLYY
ncbi:hypothetical protein JVX91_02500 [Pseudomonas sp. PDNC002]|uniref:hypothetical protein n=1 Tax=Pseudomonas sp. PDNC002 TaxID=2811422 RepID=UPI001963D339|nr:hypothetical protein [Pseudomonas sp. PDNC002]QRY80007.1 hypothetical protein JVX91_02500 [Pseudomonas sp. PDNC002]